MTKRDVAANFKAGQRIRLVSMIDDPDPIPAGTTGTVVKAYPQSGWCQLDVDWDNSDAFDSTRRNRMHRASQRCSRLLTRTRVFVVRFA